MIPKINKGCSVLEFVYWGDIHSGRKNIPNFVTAMRKFDKKTIKLASGDLTNASDLAPNIFIMKIMDLVGLRASSFANHESEGGDFLIKAMKIA